MTVAAENVKPYGDDNRQKSEQVRDMFDNIAPAYDFMNRAMTLGIDKNWRRKVVNLIHRQVHTKASPQILDVATGTADLAISMAKRIPSAHITGVDLSEGMVSLGNKKVEEAGLKGRVSLCIGDCLRLPFADATFDVISVAFGVRNFEHLDAGYKEMLRVLRPGGMLCVLELSVPSSPIVKPFYKIYTRRIIPALGRLASKDMSAYTYLPASIEAVPVRSEMTHLIESCGYKDARYISLTMGVCTIYVAYKM